MKFKEMYTIDTFSLNPNQTNSRVRSFDYQEGENMEDNLISQLPNDILISIITRIPTKEAVRTSILSKKWRNIYKFVPAINVSCHGICWRSSCDSEVITDGLHRVSQLHSAKLEHSLKSLRLSRVRALAGSLECILPNCLSLCSLLIKDCELPSKLCFRGSNLQLKCILICDCKGVEKIELYARNLIPFEIIGMEIVNIVFDYVPQLQSTENPKCVGPQLDKHVTVHPQLKKVDISGFSGSENQNGFVAYLLRSCVRLQHMYISFYGNVYNGFGEWEETKIYPLFGKSCEMVYEDIKQLKHQVISKAVQVNYQEKIPRTKSKQFTEDRVLICKYHYQSLRSNVLNK